MLPPSLGYEVGKARQAELEQQLAKRRQLEEALAVKRLQQPTVRQKVLASMKHIASKAASVWASPAHRRQADAEKSEPKLGWR
jgi:hypothetical protein